MIILFKSYKTLFATIDSNTLGMSRISIRPDILGLSSLLIFMTRLKTKMSRLKLRKCNANSVVSATGYIVH